MKEKLKHLGGAIAFVMVLVLVLGLVGYVVCEKPFDFYRLPKDSIDVLVMGNSIAYCSVAPAVMWQEEGLAAYVLAVPMTHVSMLYYYYVDFIKTQSPKVVVLEAHALDKLYEKAPGPTEYMKFSQNKIEAAQFAHGEEWMEYMVPLYRQHGRYQDLSAEAFVQEEKPENGYVFMPQPAVPLPLPKQREKPGKAEDEALSAKTTGYFEKLADLCRKQGSTLVVMRSPTMQLDRGFSNAVQALCDAQAVPYIEYFDMDEETGFDPQEDLADVSHMNYRGAEKLTRHLGQYLAQQWDVPDHRGEAAYAGWAENSKLFYRQKMAQELQAQRTFTGWLEKARDEEYLVVMAAAFLQQNEMDGHMQAALQAFGAGTALAGKRDVSFLLVKDGRDILYENIYTGSQDFQEKIAGQRVHMQASMQEGTVQIMLGRTTYPGFEPGMQVVVYDKLLKQVVDVALFDAAAPQMRA